QTLAIDLLNPLVESEKRKHKLKRLVQSPNSYFMDVKCPGCFAITTVFSHAQTVVLCGACATVLCQPTGGKARLTEGAYMLQLRLSMSFVLTHAILLVRQALRSAGRTEESSPPFPVRSYLRAFLIWHLLSTCHSHRISIRTQCQNFCIGCPFSCGTANQTDANYLRGIPY
ncbi:ribosomal protein S27-domain-containing protein, partial [Phellopilus nigrolimitatus]